MPSLRTQHTTKRNYPQNYEMVRRAPARENPKQQNRTDRNLFGFGFKSESKAVIAAIRDANILATRLNSRNLRLLTKFTAGVQREYHMRKYSWLETNTTIEEIFKIEKKNITTKCTYLYQAELVTNR